MQLFVAALAFAVAWQALNQWLHLRGSWTHVRKALASPDAGQRQVAREALGFWLLNAAFLVLSVFFTVLVATGHIRFSFP